MDNTKTIERQEKASRTLAIMLDYLGLDADLKAEQKGANIAIKIASEDAGRIIGRKGQTLENLQLLLNRMLFNGDKEFPRIMLDIDGYSRRGGSRRPASGGRRRSSRGGRPERDGMNEEQLIQQAIDASKEVKRWGENVVLPPMNSHDRRIIHITLKDDGELETHSEGDGSLKKVVISLKK
ncbi:R3H domain-containing nucleic acid-binding protein [Lentisphaerota bacterium ZTH]|nr:KH domain-containing protein [Lentisphaerota bacterium]WET06829.1 R3H domain-containing nucleic acid-binding protein [Lentisphaerota bacterium ZTH]